MSIVDEEWKAYRRDQAAGIVRCGLCQKELSDGEFATEINPEGGYGRPRILACDACLKEAPEGSYVANARAKLSNPP